MTTARFGGYGEYETGTQHRLGQEGLRRCRVEPRGPV